MEITEIGWEDMDWMHLYQDRDQWRDLVKTVMNFRVHVRRGISWLSGYQLLKKDSFSCT